MSSESRWKQRFQNFEKAFIFFESVVEQKDYTLLEIAGLVKAFEFTFELGWKMIKDYLVEQGITSHSPREAIKEGFKAELIDDGFTWLYMLENRNELSHTYNQDIAHNAVEIIKFRYYPAISQVYNYFKQKIEEKR